MTVSTANAAVGSPADVVTQFLALLAAAGWTVSGSTVQAPAGGATYSLAVTSVVQDGGQGWTLSSSVGLSAEISQRRTVGSSASGTQVYDVPTKLTIFTDPAPGDGNSWAACVISFGFNAYRHFYLGKVSGRIGGFTGGEIVAGSHCRVAHDMSQGINANENVSHQRLFNGNCQNGGASSGGVNVVHGSNPNSLRLFGGSWENSNNLPPSSFFTSQLRALGGIGDEVNDGYGDRSPSMFMGGFSLVPFNLFIDGPGGYFIPIGYAPGVRACLVLDPAPETIMTIAGKTWQVFPVFKKSSSPYGAGGSGWTDESSWYYGLAYEAT